ncbi:MAG: hypothetical protein PHQ54_03790, partial [Candidatus Omnitrophica bacterium]|nr:hypothetical protein [Candidatus Omnitrophota bacterium]
FGYYLFDTILFVISLGMGNPTNTFGIFDNILSMTDRSNIKLIRAFAPLSELFGYATIIRSLTQGRATFVMQPSHYDVVPNNIAEKIIGKF